MCSAAKAGPMMHLESHFLTRQTLVAENEMIFAGKAFLKSSGIASHFTVLDHSRCHRFIASNARSHTDKLKFS